MIQNEISSSENTGSFDSVSTFHKDHPLNSRLLVIDDDEVVREVMTEILSARPLQKSSLTSAHDALFGSPSEKIILQSDHLKFEITTCSTGKEGFELAKRKNHLGEPFATVFVDMKMPGWNGIETIRNIRSVDPDIEVNFVSAYSDFNLAKMREAGGPEISYICKPFSADEITQAATRSVCAWNQKRSIESLIERVSHIASVSIDFDTFFLNLSCHFRDIMGTKEFAVFQKRNNSEITLLGTSALSDQTAAFCKIAQEATRLMNSQIKEQISSISFGCSSEKSSKTLNFSDHTTILREDFLLVFPSATYKSTFIGKTSASEKFLGACLLLMRRFIPH